jgi:hypothetical protein
MAEDELSIRSDTKGFEQLAAAAEQAASAVAKIGAQAQHATGDAQKLADQVARANAPISSQQFSAALNLPIGGGAVGAAAPAADGGASGTPAVRARSLLDLSGHRAVQLGDLVSQINPQVGYMARLLSQATDEMARLEAAGAGTGEILKVIGGAGVLAGLIAVRAALAEMAESSREAAKALDEVVQHERELARLRLAGGAEAAARAGTQGRPLTPGGALGEGRDVASVVDLLGEARRAAAERAAPLLTGKPVEEQLAIVEAIAAGAGAQVDLTRPGGVQRLGRAADRFRRGPKGAFIGESVQTEIELEKRRRAAEIAAAQKAADEAEALVGRPQRFSYEDFSEAPFSYVNRGMLGDANRLLGTRIPTATTPAEIGATKARTVEQLLEDSERERESRRRHLGPVSYNIGVLNHYGGGELSRHGPAGGYGALDHADQFAIG